MRRRIIILALLLLVVFAAWAVLRRRNGDDIGPTVKVVRGSIERVVVASGTIEPEDLVEVRSKVSGIVEHFHVDAGDRVKAGQVVAEIDRETLAAAVREARAYLHEAEVDREHAGLELRRKHDLFERGVESKEVLDRYDAEHRRAQARHDRAQATLQRLDQELAWATIAAPIDGLVLQRDLNPGAAVASVAAVTGGTVLMTIADTSKMHLLGVVDENEIAQVKIGMPARVTTDTYPGRVFPGEVRKIASLGDRKDNVTSFKVEVTILEEVDALWPRMSGDADIIAEIRNDTLIIPETALRYDGNEVMVDVVEHASSPRLARRSVRLGVSNVDKVEVLDGVKEGEEIKVQ
jgi:HlyD family secretion protein